jgi:hypothetical protein
VTFFQEKWRTIDIVENFFNSYNKNNIIDSLKILPPKKAVRNPIEIHNSKHGQSKQVKLPITNLNTAPSIVNIGRIHSNQVVTNPSTIS